jgi:P27 family predicted phage terminase small subunit
VPRPAKTEQQHDLEGTVSQVGRSKTTQAASRYAGGRPDIPQHLGKLARKEFRRVCYELEHRKTLTSGDRLTIAVLAECYERWVQAKAELGNAYTITVTITDKNGHTITTVKANPLLKVVEVCEARILSLQSALGLTPLARDKVRPTQLNPGEEIIPGSIGDLYPELVGRQPTAAVVFKPMPPPATIEEDEQESQEETDGNA